MTPEDTVTTVPNVPATAPSMPSADAALAATPEFRKVGPVAAVKVEGDDVQANLSAVGTVTAGSLSATGTAIGAASIEGDATITASMVPALMTKGETTVQQSYASAVIVGGGANTKIHQAAAPLIIGRTVEMSQSGAGAVLTGEADVKSSWVGIVLAPKATISEDSRVIIDTRAALIIGLALFGGMGLVALAITLGVRRIMRWRPSISLPGFPNISLPSLASLPSRVDLHAIQERFMHHDAA